MTKVDNNQVPRHECLDPVTCPKVGPVDSSHVHVWRQSQEGGRCGVGGLVIFDYPDVDDVKYRAVIAGWRGDRELKEFTSNLRLL